MGVCFYCLRHAPIECFGWDEAKGCCGISGPDDPKYLERSIAYYRRKVRESEAEEKTAKAKARELVVAAQREVKWNKDMLQRELSKARRSQPLIASKER